MSHLDTPEAFTAEMYRLNQIETQGIAAQERQHWRESDHPLGAMLAPVYCLHCGTHEDLTLDHVIALANGGGDDDANLQTLCGSCNSSKGTK